MTHLITIFYVYAETDEALRQQLEKHLALLRRQGVIADWQESLAGAEWEQEREQAFNKASLILLLVSADFLVSDVCYQEQMQRALERQTRGEVQVLPILVRPVDVTNAPFTHLPMVPTNGKAVTVWNNQDAAWTHITEGIRCVLEGKPLPMVQEQKEAAKYTTKNQQIVYGQIIGEHNEIHHHYPPIPVPPPPEAKRVWMVPYAHNPFFTGRDAVLSDLHQRFKRGQAQAVSQPQAMSGLGGIGKTQIAVEFAYRQRQDYRQVLWASAETAELLTSAYTQIATRLDLPEKEAKDQEIVFEAVKRWLQEHQEWLLILDNSDEPEVLEPFLPPMVDGHILVTTRASDLTTLGLGFGHSLEIETFTVEQGVLFVLHRAGLLALDATIDQAKAEDRQRAMELSEELGGLPLALDQAGAYIAQARCTLESYQQLYQTHRRQLLKERRGKKEHPDPVATTWSLSFKRVEEKNPAAAELLHLCAFLAPDAIPEEILTAGASVLGAVLAPVASDALLLNQAIEVVRAYSLIRRDPKEKTLSIHRLVQAVLQDTLKEEEKRTWAERAILAVNATFPGGEHSTWSLCERLLPQALRATQRIEDDQIRRSEAGRLLSQTAWYLKERARYHEAEPLYLRALAIQEQALGPEHPEIAHSSLYGLAELYREQGKYVEAEPLYLRALHIQELQWGPEHPDVARTLNKLARLYHDQSRYAEAEPLYLRALRTQEQQLGSEHPQVAHALNDLASLSFDQGKYVEAELFYQRALQICEQQLEPEHPDLARTLHNLANLYNQQGKYVEAELLYLRALRIREQQGPEHPDVARTLNGLAVLYQKQGKYTEAELLYQQALQIWEHQLEPEHLYLAYLLSNLADLYRNQGKYAKAEPLFQRALQICEQQLGLENHGVAYPLSNLAALYRDQDKYAEAEPLFQRALHICEQQVGPYHLDVAELLREIAEINQHQEKYEQAEPLYQRALKIWEQSLGAEHPTSKIGRSNYAGLLRVLGREEEAAALEVEGQ